MGKVLTIFFSLYLSWKNHAILLVKLANCNKFPVTHWLKYFIMGQCVNKKVSQPDPVVSQSVWINTEQQNVNFMQSQHAVFCLELLDWWTSRLLVTCSRDGYSNGLIPSRNCVKEKECPSVVDNIVRCHQSNYHTTCINCHTTCINYHTTCINCHTTCINYHTTCINYHTTCINCHTTCINCHTTCINCHTTCINCHSH